MKYHLNAKHSKHSHEDQPKITDYRKITKEKKLKLDTQLQTLLLKIFTQSMLWERHSKPNEDTS